MSGWSRVTIESSKLACEAARHWDEVSTESKKRMLSTQKNDTAKTVTVVSPKRGTTRSILAKKFRVGENHVDAAHRLMISDPERFERVAAGLEPLTRADKVSCVYFIGHKDRPDLPVKIGKATDAKARRAHLQCAHYTELIILFTLDGYSKLEKELHTRFSKKHVRGEWFDLSQTDLDSLRKEFNI